MLRSRGLFEFKTFRSIQRAALKCHGMLFGGCVRDSVLHDDHAQRFYEAVKADRGDALSPNELQALYDDAAFMPTLSGRLVVPSDIDVVFFRRDDFDSFMETCATPRDGRAFKLDHSVTLYGNGQPRGRVNSRGRFSRADTSAQDSDSEGGDGEGAHYACNLRRGWYLRRLTFVVVDTHNDVDFSGFKFHVDAVVPRSRGRAEDTPFLGKDFLCNRMTMHRSRLGKASLGMMDKYDCPLEEVQAVLKAAEHAKARVALFVGPQLTPALRQRALKMLAKGYALEGVDLDQKSLQLVPLDPDGACGVCYKEGVRMYARIGDGACSHAFCLDCIRRVHDTAGRRASCPMCRWPWPVLTDADEALAATS